MAWLIEQMLTSPKDSTFLIVKLQKTSLKSVRKHIVKFRNIQTHDNSPGVSVLLSSHGGIIITRATTKIATTKIAKTQMRTKTFLFVDFIFNIKS